MVNGNYITQHIRPERSTMDPTSVYIYKDAQDVVIYVGVTGVGITRNKQHNKDKAWWPYVASQHVLHFPTRAEALDRERELIRTHKPPFNRQGNNSFKLMNAAYAMLHSAPESSDDSYKLVRSLGKKLPLSVSSLVAGTLSFVSRPEHLAVSSRIHYIGPIRVLASGTEIGRCTDIKRAGMFIRLDVPDFSDTRWTFTEAVARVKVFMAKRGREYYGVECVHVVDPVPTTPKAVR